MVALTDQELLLRLRNFEDNFVERKTSGDSKDWLKTVVAFANSTPVDYPAVLYIGVKNDGTPENRTVNLDALQKTLGEKVGEAYPPIYYLTRILNLNGKQVLAVIVPGSADRPHFAGQAYVREGSKTVSASRGQFEVLIASRNSKAYEILKWKGKRITRFSKMASGSLGGQRTLGELVVIDCNQFYVTWEDGGRRESIPLERISISFDHKEDRLGLYVSRFVE